MEQNENILPSFLKPQDWASPLSKTEDGIVMKVMDPASNYYGTIFIMKTTTLKVFENEDTGETYINYEYDVDGSADSKVNRFGAMGLEEEIKRWILNLLTNEMVKDQSEAE